MREDVAAAVDDLYEVFSRHTLKPHFEDRCSPVADRRELARALCGGRLRSLPVNELAQYAFKSLSTMGNEEDFKHFLPRMLLERAFFRHQGEPFADELAVAADSLHRGVQWTR
jgi:hypothetical protein